MAFCLTFCQSTAAEMMAEEGSRQAESLVFENGTDISICLDAIDELRCNT